MVFYLIRCYMSMVCNYAPDMQIAATWSI